MASPSSAVRERASGIRESLKGARAIRDLGVDGWAQVLREPWPHVDGANLDGDGFALFDANSLHLFTRDADHEAIAAPADRGQHAMIVSYVSQGLHKHHRRCRYAPTSSPDLERDLKLKIGEATTGFELVIAV